MLGPLTVLAGGLQLAIGSFPTWIGAAAIWFWRVPSAIAMLGSPPPKVTIAVDRCQIVHDGLFTAPVTVTRAQLHSIVPVHLRPLKQSPVRLGPRLPSIGDVSVGKVPALVLVFREERELRQARSALFVFGMVARNTPVRGLVLVVDDLEKAQWAFQPWGLLARLTPQAFEWLAPRSSATSPGPDPVYGT
ncbi:MAG TPA: hypothetical protein VFU93_08075 [Acidimicrobiales bacterium]|nr:hypothetical protein [Acidimicrobiales bacterium]